MAFGAVGLCLSAGQSGVTGHMMFNGVGLDFVFLYFKLSLGTDV